MLSILSKNTTPAVNIATEEFLLKNFDEDIIFIYRNEKSIIVGKHQNTLSEINYSFTKENHIPVIRRLSGGGTVFHDLGNINFCFITSEKKGELVNFKKFTQPIIEYLKLHNIEATFGGRNDILIEGKKISGNACHVFKNRVMHHGTLLFESQLEDLTNALKNDPLKYTDKAVKSVRSKVTNIVDYLIKDKFTAIEFSKGLIHFLGKKLNASNYDLSSSETDEIQQMVKSKYATWDWNYAYSPSYVFKRRIKAKSGKRFEITLKIKKGYILYANIRTNSKETGMIEEIQNLIGDKIHKKDVLFEILNSSSIRLNDITIKELVEALF